MRPTSDEAILFVDRNLGNEDVPPALRAAGARVEVHDDHFPMNCTDEVWLRHIGARGWVLLTKDKRIRRRPLELLALREAGVAAFGLASGNLSGLENAKLLVKALPQIYRFLHKYRRPMIATISETGRVTLVEGLKRGGPKPDRRVP